MSLLSKSTHRIGSIDNVDLWLCHQDELALQIDAYAPLLSPEELTRAYRFHFSRDQNRFIIGRALLRLILSTYLDRAPNDVEIGYRAHGKPYLLHQPISPDLQFNLAHSEGIAIYAIAHGREVGVDLEKLRPLPDAAAIAQRFFAPAESVKLKSVLGTEQEVPTFFNGWTRKEAFLKSEGAGLFRALDSFEVTLLPEEVPQIVHVEGLAQDEISCTLHAFEPTPGFVAALVVEDEKEKPCTLSTPTVT
jgi:4'-phosphopantetheinyl transferase